MATDYYMGNGMMMNYGETAWVVVSVECQVRVRCKALKPKPTKNKTSRAW